MGGAIRKRQVIETGDEIRNQSGWREAVVHNFELDLSAMSVASEA